MKPRLFVASSTEGLDIAYAIQENLEHNAETTVWPQGVFELSATTIESLIEIVDSFDFAAFVFTFDDIVMMRDEVNKTVRDNVLFELGLFIGRIGRDRSFIIMPRSEDRPHLPTDLLGLTPAFFEPERSDSNMVAALGPACNKIRRAIKRLEVAPQHMAKQGFPQLVAFYDTYRQVDWAKLLNQAQSSIDIVVYYFDSWVNYNYEHVVNFFRRDGTRMRIFVADPHNQDLIANVRRLFPEYIEATIKEKISHTGERLANALRDAGGTQDRLEFYYVPHFLNYSIQCFDEETLVLSVFEMFRQHKIDSPAVILDLNNSDHLLRYWTKELEGLLRVSEKIEATPGAL